MADESAWLEDSNYSLIQGMFDAQALVEREGTSDSSQNTLVRFCQELGLWKSTQTPAVPHHAWEITIETIDKLHSLPPKRPHAGKFDWVGTLITKPPKWLWDSRENCTVRADSNRLREGYIAVSYTWGRWKIAEKREIGTPWPLPIVDPVKCKFDLTDFKLVLSHVKICRYFWIDVLCIDQTNSEEMREEIAKQGFIFDAARAVITCLWSLNTGLELAYALRDFGDRFLWSLRVSGPETRESSFLVGESTNDHDETFAEGLRSDPWFSSLWTLQEMILCNLVDQKWSVLYSKWQHCDDSVYGDRVYPFVTRDPHAWTTLG